MTSSTRPPPGTWGRLRSAVGPTQLADRDVDLWQTVLGVVTVVLSLATVRPLGLHGRGLVLLVLLTLNCLLLLQRVFSERQIPEHWRLRLLVVGAVASGALMSLASLSIATLFPYFVAGHAGYRLPARRAFAVAGLTSVATVVGLLAAQGSGRDAQPWYVGLLVGLPVLLGRSNRQHAEAQRSAVALAEQTRRTADAQAESQALAERARIARDVHDVLAHSLAAVNMQLEVTDALLEDGRTAEARESARRAQRLVREGLGEVQRTVRALREDVLPVAETLAQLVASSGGAEDAFSVVGPSRALSTEVAQTLVRCAQEALTNARRHAGRARVQVTLSFDEAQVSLEVLNAAGERPAGTDEGSGLGLVGMRERVALVGGAVTTGPVPDGSVPDGSVPDDPVPDDPVPDDPGSGGAMAGGWRIHVVIPT